jgi:plastocyanin
MKKLGFAVIALALIASGCGVGGSGSNERTVLVDYSYDEFATALFMNFPKKVDVTPGMTVEFKQIWTGEPHTVTGGTAVDEMMVDAGPWIEFFDAFGIMVGAGDVVEPSEESTGPASVLFDQIARSDEREARERLYAAYDQLRENGVPLVDREDPGDASLKSLNDTVTEYSDKIFEDIGLPWAFGETDITQNAGQPCYLDKGLPPKAEDKPCAESQQRQPAFDGTARYYNSGIIPYEGPQGNTFRVKLADDIAPGNYFFYCAVHGPGQVTELTVKPEGTSVESQEDVNKRARAEIEAFAKPMVRAFDDAKDGELDMRGEKLEGPFAGLTVPVHGILNEMVPKTIRTNVGDQVTWKLMGADHSISFDVPRYFPIMRFANNGKISLNPQLQKPAGGSPPLPKDVEVGPDDAGGGVIKIDGGTYDGSGFFSSGLIGAEPYAEYSLRFSEPGSYKYACLLHPPMVGTVVVS